jgi:Arc/MetJ-type ribon-helix-helix transcriptional regulator
MRKQNERISTRLTDHERQQIEQLVGKGEFKNLSNFLRCAIERLLENT